MAKTSNLENALNYKQIKKYCLKLALSAIEALESNLSIQHNLNWFKKVFQSFYKKKVEQLLQWINQFIDCL